MPMIIDVLRKPLIRHDIGEPVARALQASLAERVVRPSVSPPSTLRPFPPR
jgi:hypothetical protein